MNLYIAEERVDPLKDFMQARARFFREVEANIVRSELQMLVATSVVHENRSNLFCRIQTR